MAYSLKYSYSLASQSYLVTGYLNITTSDNVVIPSAWDDGTHGKHPVTSISKYAFQNCSSLTSVTIGDSVTSIDYYAFQDCTSLTSITIPNSVTSIDGNAFSGCSSLTSMTIPFVGATKDGTSNTHFGYIFGASSSSSNPSYVPSSLKTVVITGGKSIGSTAFYKCTHLKQLILFPSSPPTLGSNAIPSTITIYVQQSSKEAYKTATNWTAFAKKIVANDMSLYFAMNARATKKWFKSKIYLDNDGYLHIANIVLNNNIKGVYFNNTPPTEIKGIYFNGEIV